MTDKPAGQRVVIHTDGGSKGNPGPGGWGAILQWGTHRKEMKGGEAHTTNNRMELMAAIMALEALKAPVEVDIYTDSQYLRDGITKWILGWKRNGWRTADKNPVKNVELWQRLEAAASPHKVNWHWLRGHAGHPLNERADTLANQAIAEIRAKGSAGETIKDNGVGPKAARHAPISSPPEHLLDELAVAYVQAIAARAGATIAVSRSDYGMEGTLKQILRSEGERCIESGVAVGFQLKGSTLAKISGDHVQFDLSARNHDLIVTRKATATPYYLFLVCFGSNPENWLEEEYERLILNASAFWWTDSGAAAGSSSTVRIRIPLANRLTSPAIEKMLQTSRIRFAT